MTYDPWRILKVRWSDDDKPKRARPFGYDFPQPTEQPSPAPKWDDGLVLPLEVVPGTWLMQMHRPSFTGHWRFWFDAPAFQTKSWRDASEVELNAMSRDEFRAWLRTEAEKLAPRKHEPELMPAKFLKTCDRPATSCGLCGHQIVGYAYRWHDTERNYRSRCMDCGPRRVAGEKVPRFTPLGIPGVAHGYREAMQQMATMSEGLSRLADEIFEATHAGMTICTGASDLMVREGIDPDDEERLGIRAQYIRHQLAELQAKRETAEAQRIGWMPYSDEGEG